MYKKIMVPVDLEHVDKIEKALHAAAELAKSYQVPVCYVAVATQEPNRVASSPKEFEAELNRFAAEQGAKYSIESSAFTIASVDVTAELDHKLLQAIDDVEADLVVMASHIPGIADHLHLLPSNAANIVKHTRASVFVVR